MTNSEEFLAGKEKLKVQEIGPYTYSAPQVKKVKEWSHDQNSITFQSKTTYTYFSMTQLLTHSVAHSTRPSSRPKTNNQPLKKFLSLALS